MSIPIPTEQEAQLSPDVMLYNASSLLATHKTKRYRKKKPEKIKRVYIHHSGADNPEIDGFRAMAASARFVTQHRGFPGFAYTYWVSIMADRDSLCRLVCYRGQPDDVRSWHTGLLANADIAICLEGNTSKLELSSDQEQVLEALVPWLLKRHWRIKLPHGLSMHSEAWKFGGRRKKACPGSHAEEWVKAYRAAA